MKVRQTHKQDARINPAAVWYKDTDNDGYSDGATLTQCERPNGYKLASELIAVSGDCYDSDSTICPNDQKCPERCGDNLDNNCNGEIDEGCCEVSIKVSPSEVYPQKTSGNTEADIIASWSKPAPPEGCTVKFKVEPVEKSGGHNHDGNRPKGSVSPDTLPISGGSVGVVSGTHKYASSEVSGEEKIIAEIDGEKKDEAMVRVRVPGLSPLGNSIVYNLTGAPPGSSHPSNHYGTSSTNSSAYNIAFDYLYETDTILGINDMSLAWGGLFDITGDWRPPHNLHRAGKSVDIDTNVYDFNNGKYILIPCEKDRMLKEIVKEHGGKLKCESRGRKHIEIP